MKIVTKAAVEGMLSKIEDDIEACNSKEKLVFLVEFYKNYLDAVSWDDPDYYYDRKAQLVKKVDGKYINKNDLVSHE